MTLTVTETPFNKVPLEASLTVAVMVTVELPE